MNDKVKFNSNLIAPCGMNCGSCLAYMRSKYHCPGCRVHSVDKAKTVLNCIIVNCKHLQKTASKCCFECANFPCKRLNQLDKRYRTNYNTSFIENLEMINNYSLNYFLQFESQRRTCPNCGATICVHRSFCLECKTILN